jgi:cell division protein FtsW
VQPSEFAKVALIMALAAYAHAYRHRMAQPLVGLLLPGIGIAVILGLVLVGKDLGTTALPGCSPSRCWFAAGTRLRHLVPVALAGGVARRLPRDRSRAVAPGGGLPDPVKFAETIALQSTQSKIAIGSGGLVGRGLGNGIHKSGFGPEQPTDFIFSVIGEELGLRVTLPLTVAYLAFTLAALRIARRAPDVYGSMIACGVGLLVGLQAILNIAVTTDSVPNKGLALPFVSYGGSCLIVMLTSWGCSSTWPPVRPRGIPGVPPDSDDREASARQSA